MSVEQSKEQVSPEQIAQSKEIHNISNTLQKETQSRLQNPALQKLGEKYLLQVDMSLHQNPENKSVIQEYQDTLDALEKLDGYSSIAWFEQFSQLLTDQNLKPASGFLNVIEKNNRFRFYIESNGFPVSPLSLDLMNREFWLWLSTETKEKEKVLNAGDANIERLIDLYENLWPSLDAGSKTALLLQKIAAGNTEAYIELKTLLLEDSQELESLLVSAKEKDEAEGDSSNYDALKFTLLDIDPSFESKITAFEEKYSPNLSLERAYIHSLSGSNIRRDGNNIISEGEYSENIVLDISKRPPHRSIALEGSSYRIEANHSLGEIHKPDIEYKAIYDNLIPQIKSASLLKTKSVQDHIGDMLEHGYGIWEVKRTLSLCYHINTEYLSNLGDLSPSSLESTVSKLTQQLDSAMNAYRRDLKDAARGNKEKVMEADKKKREVLLFVHSLGFDVIDQKHTDQLITEIKSNALHVEGLPLNPARLDISSGMFGESPSEGGSTKWKENLIKFFNKLISGTFDQPISIDAHISAWWKVEEKTEIIYALTENGVLSSGGAFNVDRARENLRKV